MKGTTRNSEITVLLKDINRRQYNQVTQPMLAATIDADNEFALGNLEYPLYLSPKIDGIRCLCHPEKGPVTRSFKAIPNKHIREHLQEYCDAELALDGELVGIRSDGTPMKFNETQSAVMSHGGKPDFKYYVFDLFNAPHTTYSARNTTLQVLCTIPEKYSVQLDDYYTGSLSLSSYIELVPQHLVHGALDIITLETSYLQAGNEGVMLRDPAWVYKSGRSTLKQQGLLKLKRFADAEGTIVDFEELMHNDNEQTRDEFGYAERSSHKDNLRPGDTLGALVVHTEEWGTFRIGSGFDMALREKIWKNRGMYAGVAVTFKYQKIGMQDVPRFPIFLGFRYDLEKDPE